MNAYRQPLSTIARGILAGALGTAAMTAHQELRQRLGPGNGEPQNSEPPQAEVSEQDRWDSAPAPAQVGERLIEGLLGRRVSSKAIPVLTQVMHWSYGSVWGSAYALTRESMGASASRLGPLFGLAVWTASYVQLVPLGIYEPPWCYPLSATADEVAYHLTYGTAVAAAYGVLRRRDLS